MIIENDIILNQRGKSSQVSRRVEVGFNRALGGITVTSEIGMEGMSALSQVERHVGTRIAATLEEIEMLTRSAIVSRPSRVVSPAEVEIQQRLLESYACSMSRLAEITNSRIVRNVEMTSERFAKRTLGDVLEDFLARIADCILGRPHRYSALNGRR